MNTHSGHSGHSGHIERRPTQPLTLLPHSGRSGGARPTSSSNRATANGFLLCLPTAWPPIGARSLTAPHHHLRLCAPAMPDERCERCLFAIVAATTRTAN